MSLDFLTRPIGGKKKVADDAEPSPRDRSRRGSRPNPEDVRRPGTLTIGGVPRVDLMPPEIRVKRSQLRTRRSLRLGLIGVAAVVVLGCGATVAWSTLAGVGLVLAQSQQVALLQQQSQFADVKNATQQIQLIKAGQKVVMYFGAANRDPARFEHADTLDLAREVNEHIAFGVGPHYCVGHNVARVTLRVLFDELLSRFTGFRPAGEPVRLHSNLISGYKHVPITARRIGGTAGPR